MQLLSGDYWQIELHSHPELPAVSVRTVQPGEQHSCSCLHGHGKNRPSSARLQPLVIQVVLKTLLLDLLSVFCRSILLLHLLLLQLLTFQDWDLQK